VGSNSCLRFHGRIGSRLSLARAALYSPLPTLYRRVADALCATPRGLARTSAPSLETLAVLGPPSCTLTARDAKTPRRAMAELCSSRGLLDAAVGR